MDKQTIEKANRLQRQIEWLETLIKGDIGLCWGGFMVHFTINFGPSQGRDVYHQISRGLDISEQFEVEQKMKGVLREVLEKKRSELEQL